MFIVALLIKKKNKPRNNSGIHHNGMINKLLQPYNTKKEQIANARNNTGECKKFILSEKKTYIKVYKCTYCKIAGI